MMERTIPNSDGSLQLPPCKVCGGKPKLKNTHVACSNPRCSNWSNTFRDTEWVRDYKVDGVTNRAERTWEEK